MKKNRLRWFNIEGGESQFVEMQFLTTKQALQAIRENAELGGMIELYYSRDEPVEGQVDVPDIGFVFKDGKYAGHGLGPGPGETGWLRDLTDRANTYIGKDGRDMERFIIDLNISES